MPPSPFIGCAFCCASRRLGRLRRLPSREFRMDQTATSWKSSASRFLVSSVSTEGMCRLAISRKSWSVDQLSTPSSIPQASISPTHAAPQHNKTHSDQRVKPCWKNQPTLKLWRESPDSERESPTIPPLHHQGFWQKARKCSGISKPTLD
jgi:hypothetical protein